MKDYVYSDCMKNIIFQRILLLLILLSGCRSITNPTAKTGEGTITYDVYYPDSMKYGIRTMFFPKTITLVFKDEKAAFIATGGMGMVQLVNLLDHKAKSYTSLLIDNLRDNYGCVLTPEEIEANESTPEYVFEPTAENKNIAGVKCRKAIVRDKSNNSSFDIYYYDQLTFYYWNSPFKNFNHLFLEYTHTINNLTMKLVATKVDLTTPVDTNLFRIRGEYKWVNEKAFYQHLNEL